MKKIILIALLAFAFIMAKPIRIEVSQPNWSSPAYHILEDVKNYQWIADRTVLRVWFYSGDILDLNIGSYEVKIIK